METMKTNKATTADPRVRSYVIVNVPRVISVLVNLRSATYCEGVHSASGAV